jgi:hypothetical protein
MTPGDMIEYDVGTVVVYNKGSEILAKTRSIFEFNKPFYRLRESIEEVDDEEGEVSDLIIPTVPYFGHGKIALQLRERT